MIIGGVARWGRGDSAITGGARPVRLSSRPDQPQAVLPARPSDARRTSNPTVPYPPGARSQRRCCSTPPLAESRASCSPHPYLVVRPAAGSSTVGIDRQPPITRLTKGEGGPACGAASRARSIIQTPRFSARQVDPSHRHLGHALVKFRPAWWCRRGRKPPVERRPRDASTPTSTPGANPARGAVASVVPRGSRPALDESRPRQPSASDRPLPP